MTPEPRRRLCLATVSPNPSGVGQHLLTLASALAADHDVTVAAPRGSLLLAQATALGCAGKALDDDDGDLARWLGRARFDLVHLHAGIGWEGHGLTSGARAAASAVIRTEHLPFLLTDPAQQAEHRAAVAAVDRLICVSQAVADSHLAAGIESGKVVTILNGADAREVRRDPAALRVEMGLDGGPLLLMVGRFEPQKAHGCALDALPTVLAAYPTATLLMVGDGPLLPDIARRIGRERLGGAVRLLGRSDDVGTLYAMADLLVMPSEFEGLPLAVLEAFAAGLPAAAAAAPGVAELVEDGVTGWLAPVGDAQTLGRTIVAALAGEAARNAAGRAAQAVWKDRYQARRMTDETTALYRAVLADRISPEGHRVTRVAFIGAGGIAHRHFGVLEQFDDVTIVGVCDTDEDRAREAAERFGALAFTDADAMLDEVAADAAYICVPPFAHGGPERAAIRRGLPFFVEKPVALDLATAEAIGEEVESRGLVTAVGYHWRYLDTVDEVRGLLARTPARLVSGYWLDSTPPPRWWWHQDQSGGQMLEQTTHLIDLARYLLGPVTRAYGLAGHDDRAEFPDLDVATVSTASLQFASGAVGNFASTCLLGWNHRVGLHLFGDRLAIELTDHDVMIDTGQGRPVRGNGSDPVWQEDRDFIDAVQGKENRIRCPYGEALETLRLCLAIGESARSGEAVTLAVAAKEPALV
ncbi:glycosyltransferase [Sphingomonas sp.]|uniref:glycosyltransferase n=1 Tax=Sphingomonas sp. TaxID=28214 RepID=UPI003CC5E8D0